MRCRQVLQTKGLSSLPIPHSDENCYRFNWANLLPNCVSIRDKYKTAERLKRDYWLYVVFNCGTMSEVYVIRDAVTLGRQPVTSIEHYQLGLEAILRQDERE
ncbi:MAG: hypothetical protein IM485_06060 [Microcystis sp. M169S2]|nr:hypothetical protein [Microcystis sp. M169S2]